MPVVLWKKSGKLRAYAGLATAVGGGELEWGASPPLAKNLAISLQNWAIS